MDLEKLIKRYELWGKNHTLKFKGDESVYYLKGLTPDRKGVFVTLNGLQTYMKKLNKLEKVNGKEIVKESVLMTFETFVPKNLEKRQEEFKRIQEKEEKELNDLASRLPKIIEGFKDLKINDEREQFFIDKFKNCKIKTDHKIYPNEIFFFDQKDNYLASYDSKNEEFWISLQNIWSFLESNYDLNYDQVKELTKAWIEQHFKLRLVSVWQTTCSSKQ